jgi:asparagine synthase (glutamine-hydrolysing)
VEALDARSASASLGPLSLAWTTPAVANTSGALAVATGSITDVPTRFDAEESPAAVVSWDPAAGDGFLAVDPLGAASLFIHEDGGRLLFASEVVDLLRLLPRRPTPNPGAIVRWLADGTLARGDTLFDGVRRLAGGHVVRLNERGWRTERYWSPRFGGAAEGDAAEQAARLRDGIAAAVERAASAAVRPGILLSGGLDSGTVAAFAARGRPLRSYSAVFPGQPDVDETPTIDALTQHLTLDSRQVAVRQIQTLAPAESYIRRWALPPSSPLLAVHEPLLERAAADEVDVLLDGQGGDELFGESPYLVVDRVRRGRLEAAGELARVWAPHSPAWRTVVELAAKGSLPRSAHRAARLSRPRRYAPQWLRPEAARVYVDEQDDWTWKGLVGPRWWAYLADRLTAGRERAGIHDYLRHKAALAAAVGRHPLTQDLELVRLVLSLPPELAFDRSFDRPLLRRSVVGIVPEEIRLKTAKPHFTRLLVDAIGGHDYAAVRTLLGPGAEVYAYVRREAVERLFAATEHERRVHTWAWTLWRLAVCERWFQLQAGDD